MWLPMVGPRMLKFATSNGRAQSKPGGHRSARCPATSDSRHARSTITGRQFNGLTVGTDYGDDATNMTNYPLVRHHQHRDPPRLLWQDS